MLLAPDALVRKTDYYPTQSASLYHHQEMLRGVNIVPEEPSRRLPMDEELSPTDCSEDSVEIRSPRSSVSNHHRVIRPNAISLAEPLKRLHGKDFDDAELFIESAKRRRFDAVPQPLVYPPPIHPALLSVDHPLLHRWMMREAPPMIPSPLFHPLFHPHYVPPFLLIPPPPPPPLPSQPPTAYMPFPLFRPTAVVPESCNKALPSPPPLGAIVKREASVSIREPASTLLGGDDVGQPDAPVPSVPQQTRNYKNMTKERRMQANARERTRVHTISAAFEALRRAVPSFSHGQRLSKLSILRVASAYIAALGQLADGQDSNGNQLIECVNLCTRTLMTEGNQLLKRPKRIGAGVGPAPEDDDSDD